MEYVSGLRFRFRFGQKRSVAQSTNRRLERGGVEEGLGMFEELWGTDVNTCVAELRRIIHLPPGKEM
jgi:hypothetical protein